ncbi:serine/threonine protein phosphatase PrpC [Prosthecobacter fusiformis]|uniref:Serine/threonine protein phosphatase PrpC n=1 Tax=Prosthecobacter fusiformis TaxID=48464 RepID=A0A4R7RIC8_9BACT|nr:serine/threonine protein phosphatase PrpC [Prosthecobacter fusiformis]
MQEQDFAARQYKGRRDNQEDYYAFADAAELTEAPLETLLLVVGDGLGAHAGGSVASYLAVNAFVRAFHEHPGDASWRLRTALDTANETLGYITERMPSVAPPMGTTMLSVLVSRKEVQWISVGDSPLFLYRRGNLTRLNADHSLTPMLDAQVKAGTMTEDEAAHHPGRHTLQSALMGQPMALIDFAADPIKLLQDDIIIAASDGIFTLSEKALVELLHFGKNTTADKIADAIIFAIRRINFDRQDNTTVGVVKVP